MPKIEILKALKEAGIQKAGVRGPKSTGEKSKETTNVMTERILEYQKMKRPPVMPAKAGIQGLSGFSGFLLSRE